MIFYEKARERFAGILKNMNVLFHLRSDTAVLRINGRRYCKRCFYFFDRKKDEG